MSVASELHTAAATIHNLTTATAYDHAVADLLYQVAAAMPATVIETQAGPVTRRALSVARTVGDPSSATGRLLLDETASAARRSAVAVGAPVSGVAGAPIVGGR